MKEEICLITDVFLAARLRHLAKSADVTVEEIAEALLASEVKE